MSHMSHWAENALTLLHFTVKSVEQLYAVMHLAINLPAALAHNTPPPILL